MGLRVYTLGRFCVYRGDEPVTAPAWKLQKNKALLKILLTYRRHAPAREQLLEYLWPELDPAAGQRNLRVAVSQLREILEPDLPRGALSHFILTTDAGYAWNVQADYWLDAEEFDRSARSVLLLGDALDTETLSHLRLVTNLYQGDYLEEDRYADWALAERERLRETQLVLLNRLAEAHALLRQHPEAVALCRRILAVDPCRESVWRRLMLSHYYAGDHAAALRAYDQCRQVLREEMDVEPTPETHDLCEQIRRRTVPAAPAAIPHNLPRYLTPFIGRQADLAEITARLDHPAGQLVTLTGPGGIGKTRLAIQAALQQIDRFAHGAWFVALASVDSAAGLVSAIAGILRLPFAGRDDPRTRLLDYLAEKRLLLILDGFEHLLGETGLLVDILQRAPGVRVLVTSRQAVNLQAAWTIEIGGLAYPTDESRAGDGGPACEAVQLFVERAARADRSFAQRLERERPFIMQICRLVGGMPLGIELAAAWVNRSSSEQIAQAIARDLDCLATTMQDVPPPHRSLRTVFERSWNLLTEDERLVLGRLSAFRGGFYRGAGAHVAGASEATLSSLAAKSLLRRNQAGRYEMHELVRQFAAEKLAVSPENRDEAHDRHCAHYAEFMRDRAAALNGNHPSDALEEIRTEIDNVRSAWRRAVRQGRAAETGQSLDGMYGFFAALGWLSEGLEAFETAAERWKEVSEQHGLYCRLLARQGWFCERLGRYDAARAAVQSALEIATRQGLDGERVFCLYSLGNLAYQAGQYAEAQRHYLESRRIAEGIGDRRATIRALFGLGLVAEVQGEYEQAKELFRDSLALAKAAGDLIATARSANYLGLVCVHTGEYAEAKDWCRSALALLREGGDRQGTALALDYLGHTALALGEYDEAAQLYQDSLAIRRETGNRWGIAASHGNAGKAAFALGDYTAAARWLQAGLDLYREGNDRSGMADSLLGLAANAHAQGDYAQARDLGLQALVINQDLGHLGGTALSLCQLGATLLKMGESQIARSYLRQALESIRDTQAFAYKLGILAEAAGLLAQERLTALATEMVAFVLNHPAAAKRTRDQAARLLSTLETELAPEAFAGARARANALTLDSAIAAFLA